MRAFIVRKGTFVEVTKKNHRGGWVNDYKEAKLLKTDTIFFVEDVMIDPTGISKITTVPRDKITISSEYAQSGYYGFQLNRACQKAGWDIMLVPSTAVEVK